jgi:hypothetical protein
MIALLLNLTLVQVGWQLKNCCAIAENEGNKRSTQSWKFGL